MQTTDDRLNQFGTDFIYMIEGSRVFGAFKTNETYDVNDRVPVSGVYYVILRFELMKVPEYEGLQRVAILRLAEARVRYVASFF